MGDEKAAAKALEIAEELIETLDSIEELNDGGPALVFTESVREKAEDMQQWITDNAHATEKQVTALENMLEGARRWLERS